MFVDTHTHLNFKEYKDDLPEVIERAKETGVAKMIIVGSDIWNSRNAVKLAGKYEGLYATIGCHPLHIKGGWGLITRNGLTPSLIVDDFEPKDKGTAITMRELAKMLKNPKVVALGEIGLDYYQGKDGERREINRDIQCSSLQVLVDLANKEKMPAIFHCREAMKDFFRCLRKKKGIKGVLHCFPGDKDEAKRVIDLGLLISFTGVITFTDDFDEAIKFAPLDRILIETDCPFLSPEPYRGKRNEPAFVVEVAKRIAEIKKIPLAKVEEETTKSAIELFGLD